MRRPQMTIFAERYFVDYDHKDSNLELSFKSVAFNLVIQIYKWRCEVGYMGLDFKGEWR